MGMTKKEVMDREELDDFLTKQQAEERIITREIIRDNYIEF